MSQNSAGGADSAGQVAIDCIRWCDLETAPPRFALHWRTDPQPLTVRSGPKRPVSIWIHDSSLMNLKSVGVAVQPQKAHQTRRLQW